jgi:cellulose synthase/poly-beta-1,6-N-acetylglucosamine synthase-like glycosyltransferase
MLAAIIIFWILLFLIFYSYIGYGILLFFLVLFKRAFTTKKDFSKIDYEPEITLFVAAYNEKDFIDIKVKNSLELNYPQNKIKHVWLTDGSDDGTPDLLKKYPEIEVYHKDERKGKIAAMNRGMQFVKTPIVIFSDGNTLLGKNSIREIVNLFKNPKIGCVAGEKRIIGKNFDTAVGSGEGIYWKYESILKKLDAELNSVVGAAGELFAIRTELFEEIEPDTLLDDFIISLRIAMKGYKIQYNKEAYAIESASASVNEELKRKIRISAGGIQSIVRLNSLFNIFKYGLLSFQYVSHKILRWVVVPPALLILFPLNIIICMLYGNVFNITIYTIIKIVKIIKASLALKSKFLILFNNFIYNIIR